MIVWSPVSHNHCSWDTNLATFNPSAHPDYTIFRVLEFGDDDAIAWMKELFPEEEIRRVLRTERRLSPKSANFWALIYGIPDDQVATLAYRHSR